MIVEMVPFLSCTTIIEWQCDYHTLSQIRLTSEDTLGAWWLPTAGSNVRRLCMATKLKDIYRATYSMNWWSVISWVDQIMPILCLLKSPEENRTAVVLLSIEECGFGTFITLVTSLFRWIDPACDPQDLRARGSTCPSPRISAVNFSS